MQGPPLRDFKRSVNGRATHLDGLRAVAMLAICWDHWCPQHWPRIFPFEVFLFFFLVLTGYLITGSLLRERDRGDAKGMPWKWSAMKTFQIRRGLRILAPYYAALVLAWVLWVPEMHQAPLWYVAHLSNIRMALIGFWPAGVNHFWSLSIQQQFYVLWPFVIWFVPRRALWPVVIAFTLAGPVSRMFHDALVPYFPWPQTLSWFSLDYFGIGALLAMAHRRGMALESPGLKIIAGISLLGYLYFVIGPAQGWPTFGVRAVQQTFLALALTAVIANASVGFPGVLGKFLELPFLQRVGTVSYGLYLFHNLGPILAGKVFWFLWDQPFHNTLGEVLKLFAYALLTWGLTLASWRWIEQPLQGVRSRMVK